MANRLSIDWPREYYEALTQTVKLPEFAGKLAVFPVAEAGQTFKAGNFRGDYTETIVQDVDYRELDEMSYRGSTLGYEPHVYLRYDVEVPEGNVGCVMIYEPSVQISRVRQQAQRIQAVCHNKLVDVSEVTTEKVVPVPGSRSPQ